MQTAKLIEARTHIQIRLKFEEMGNELTVTVYVWLPRGGQVGHASMCLGNGTYISLWPGEDKMGKKKKRKKIEKEKKEHHNERSESLEEDIDNEGRSYDKSFVFEGLDIDAIQQWWDNFNTRWSLLGQNCCKTVIDGLRAGGSDGRLSFGDRLNYGITLIWFPFRVMEYCSKMRRR